MYRIGEIIPPLGTPTDIWAIEENASPKRTLKVTIREVRFNNKEICGTEKLF